MNTLIPKPSVSYSQLSELTLLSAQHANETVGLEYDVHQATTSSERDLEAYSDHIVSTSFESSNNDEVLKNIELAKIR